VNEANSSRGNAWGNAQPVLISMCVEKRDGAQPVYKFREGDARRVRPGWRRER